MAASRITDPRAPGPSAPKAWPMASSNLLLAALFVLTTWWALPPDTVAYVVRVAELDWWQALVGFIAWGVASRVAAGLLRRMGPDAPGWVFAVNGWMVAAIAAGLLLPFELQRFRPPDAVLPMASDLVAFGVLGLAWVVLVDGGRIMTWRLSRRPEPLMVSVATLAAVAGVVAAATVAVRRVDGELAGSPPDIGVQVLWVVLLAAVILTLLLEVPRALALRRAPQAASTSVFGTPRSAPAPGQPAAPMPGLAGPRTRPATVARQSHAAVSAPPTVVRRR